MSKLSKLSFVREYVELCNRYGYELFASHDETQCLYERRDFIVSFDLDEDTDVVLFNGGEI